MKDLNEKEMQTALLSLCLWVSLCSARKTACEPVHSADYAEVGVRCSGAAVRRVPLLLPAGLKTLQLASSGLSALDDRTFRGRRLQELTSLAVTDGDLTSVGANATCALPAIQALYLDRNRLTKLDELSFACNLFLRVVSLEGNPTLRHLPRLVSPSVDHLYLDSCRLESVDIASIKGMTALKVLSLTGNPDLHCPSVKAHFKRHRPDLRVFCEDSAGDPASRTSPDDEELTSEKLSTASDIAVNNTISYNTTSDEHRTSKTLVKSDVTPNVSVDGTTMVNIIIFTVTIVIFIGILVIGLITVRNYFRNKNKLIPVTASIIIRNYFRNTKYNVNNEYQFVK